MRSDRIVVLVRGAVLLLAVAVAYLAQHFILNSTLNGLIPPRAADLFPFLNKYVRWRNAGPSPAALWIYLTAAIAFGLAAPMWRRERRMRASDAGSPPTFGRRQAPWMYCLAAAVLSLCATLLRLIPATSWLGAILWASACGLFVFAGIRWLRTTAAENRDLFAHVDLGPLEGWPYLLAVLALTSMAVLFRWLRTPTRIDTLTAEAGLLVRDYVEPAADMVVSSLPDMSLTVTAFWAKLTGDGFVGARMAGLYASILLTVAVWLLAAEVFRRSPDSGESKASTEADAMVNQIIAASIAAFGMPAFYFARTPIVLEGVAWGSMGIWALLYGLRTGLLPVLGGSAVLVGISALYGPSGLTLAIIALAIWAGVFLLRPEWPVLTITGGQRLHKNEFIYWLLGLGISLLPVMVGILGHRQGFGAYLSLNSSLDGIPVSVASSAIFGNPTVISDLGAGMLGALLSPSFAAGANRLFGTNAMMLSAVIAPFYILGLGALLLSFDTLTGWSLACWIFLGSALSVFFSRPLAPHWSALLVCWPAVALTSAFAFDRLRSGISGFAGAWTRQASLYLMCGLVAAAAALGWLAFYEDAMQRIDAASAAGRQVRQALKAGESPVVAVSEPWSDAELRTFALLADVDVDSAQALLAKADRLPAKLSDNARLIVAAADQNALEEVRRRFPGATLSVHRIHNGNPAVYTFASASVETE